MERLSPGRRVQPFAAGRLSSRSRVLLAALPLSVILPNTAQPRKRFDQRGLEELASSIRERGVLQPIIVRRSGEGYLIMAGERRYRAARRAGLESIPAIVRDDDPLEVALIENLQRENLTPLEEAEGMAALIARHGYTHQALAALVHKSRPYVTNSLALTRLPADIKEQVAKTSDVSREILIAIARQDSQEAMLRLWQQAQLTKLSVKGLRAALASRKRPAQGSKIDLALSAAARLNQALQELEPPLAGSAEWLRLKRVLACTRKSIDRLTGMFRRVHHQALGPP